MNNIKLIIMVLLLSGCASNLRMPSHYYSDTGKQIIFIPDSWVRDKPITDIWKFPHAETFDEALLREMYWRTDDE